MPEQNQPDPATVDAAAELASRKAPELRRKHPNMPWLDDPELFVSPGNPGFDGECEPDGTPNPAQEALLEQFAMSALYRDLSQREPAPTPAPGNSISAMLALLGETFAFHDENGQIYLRLALPAVLQAEQSEASSQAHSGAPGEAQRSEARNETAQGRGALNEAASQAHPIVPFSEARRLLMRLYRQATGEYPAEPLLRRALDALAAEAVEFDSVRRMPVRVAVRNDLWLDLADGTGRALRLSPGGWKLEANPPVYFRPHAHQLALPEPRRWPAGIETPPNKEQAGSGAAAAVADGTAAAPAAAVNPEAGNSRPAQADESTTGGLGLLRCFMPALSDADWLLLLAWMTAAYDPGFPRPILCMIGPAGSGKSTLARVIRRLVDPSRQEFLALDGEVHLAATLAAHALPVFDNLGAIAPRYANLFCRAVTGDGAIRMHSDSSQRVFPYRLPILTTSLELPSRAADWLDRSLVVPLTAPQGGWRPEAGFWMRFYQLHPYLLGAMLDLVCRTLARFNPASVESFVWRMADFVNWGTAVAHALHRPASDFDAALALEQHRKSELALEEEPLAAALRELLGRHPRWQGSVQELHQLVGRKAGIRTASFLGRELRRLRGSLALSGMIFEIHRKEDGSKISILQTISAE